MKKIICLILITLILTGCSTNNSNQRVSKDKTDVTAAKDATKGGTAIKETSSGKQNSSNEQTKEIQIDDTGLSLQIPNTWHPDKYKVYKENNAIMVDYTGDKKISFFAIIVEGKKGTETPDVGLKMDIRTVDDWVIIISYSYELAYFQIDEVRDSSPSEYNDMANSVQNIISSLKIVDESKLERWFNESNANRLVPNQTINTPAAQDQPEYKNTLIFLE